MPWSKEEMAALVAGDIDDGWTVNLGVGHPTMLVDRLVGRPVLLHSENGILGMGPRPPQGQEDPDMIDAGKNPVTIVPGAAYMDSFISFSLIRGGHLDLSVMGAYQVSSAGDLANWRLPGRRVGLLGGAADIAAGARRVWVMMSHSTREGEPKILTECTYPVTARGVVQRIYTDLAVLERREGGLAVLGLSPGASVDEVESLTQAPIQVAAGEASRPVA